MQIDVLLSILATSSYQRPFHQIVNNYMGVEDNIISPTAATLKGLRTNEDNPTIGVIAFLPNVCSTLRHYKQHSTKLSKIS